MSIRPEGVEGASWEDAKQLRKQLRTGVREPHELTVEEWGLLYLYLADLLPDVDEEVRDR